MTGRLALFALGFLTATALASSGCVRAKPPPTTNCLLYKEDARFTDGERAELEAAAKSWRDSGVCVARGRGDVFIWRAHDIDVPSRHADTMKTDVLAFWCPDERAIYMLVDRIDPSHLRPVFTHELGHSAGAKHVKQLTACMWSAVTDWCAVGGRVDPQDVAAVSASYRTDP